MATWRGALGLLVLLGAAWRGEGLAGRGPHHPRGGQVAPGHSHAHYRPQRDAPKLTQDDQLLRDKEHIREDLGEWVSREDTSKMSPEELEFHYFQIHDVDNNTKLDGLEILQAILHTAPHAEAGAVDEAAGAPEEAMDAAGAEAGAAVRQKAASADDFTYYVELIDRVLLEDDLDRDGYLSYVEYVTGRQRDDAQQQAARIHDHSRPNRRR